MPTLFISDLHLEEDRPDIADQFLRFLETDGETADAIYILGDLFESWVGDDDPSEHYAWIKQALKKLTKRGKPVYFMHGNRDFMIGDDFANDTGVEILPDPYVVDLYGQRVLLSHGDAYCTDDKEYQRVRAMTRNPEWQSMMRAKPLEERLAFARTARETSEKYGESIDNTITDVNPDAIDEAMRDANVSLMLHGHTHRPAVHDLELDGKNAQRIVLGDWFEQGSAVRWDENGPVLRALER